MYDMSTDSTSVCLSFVSHLQTVAARLNPPISMIFERKIDFIRSKSKWRVWIRRFRMLMVELVDLSTREPKFTQTSSLANCYMGGGCRDGGVLRRTVCACVCARVCTWWMESLYALSDPAGGRKLRPSAAAGATSPYKTGWMRYLCVCVSVCVRARAHQGLVTSTNEVERAFGCCDVPLADRRASLTLPHHPSHLHCRYRLTGWGVALLQRC